MTDNNKSNLASNKQHWENVYQNKTDEQVSWTQKTPITALTIISSFELDTSAKIIDVGAGNSLFVDYLLELGYEDITVLDISTVAIEKAKIRLGERAKQVTWVVADITSFTSDTIYDVWHDRAVFHFLTATDDIEKYQEMIKKYVDGYLIMETFAKSGPNKCSGLPVTQYDTNDLMRLFEADFRVIESFYEDHITPFQTTQKFTFCSFKRKSCI